MKYISRRNLILFIFGFICFVIFLFAQIPATFGWQFVPADVKKQVQLSGIQGTIWNGSAATSYFNGQDTGRMRWQLSPFTLLVGKLGVSFNLVGKSGTLSGDVIMNETELSASNIKSNLRASFFNPFIAKQLPLPVMLQGKINADLDSVYFERGKRIQFSGQISWNNAEVQGMQNIPLGKVTLNADMTDTGSTIKIVNKDNPLDIKGDITLSQNGQYDINIGLLNRDKSRKDLKEMLSFLGSADSSGRHHFKQKGALRI